MCQPGIHATYLKYCGSFRWDCYVCNRARKIGLVWHRWSRCWAVGLLCPSPRSPVFSPNGSWMQKMHLQARRGFAPRTKWPWQQWHLDRIMRNISTINSRKIFVVVYRLLVWMGSAPLLYDIHKGMLASPCQSRPVFTPFWPRAEQPWNRRC